MGSVVNENLLTINTQDFKTSNVASDNEYFTENTKGDIFRVKKSNKQEVSPKAYPLFLFRGGAKNYKSVSKICLCAFSFRFHESDKDFGEEGQTL